LAFVSFTFFEYTKLNKTESEEGNGLSFHQWLRNHTKFAKEYTLGYNKFAFSNTARYNHIVWRFSGGKFALNINKKKERERKPAFGTAIRALSQHDLILPMDLMTKDKTGKVALQQLLGWDKFQAKGRFKGGDTKDGHIVLLGGVKNSNAREYFSEDEYRALWDRNWLDHILCLWCRAVFLARLHCKDAIVDQ